MTKKKNAQFFDHISFLDKMLFTKHLSVMLKSGITITEALDTLGAQIRSESFHKVLTDIVGAIRNGNSLAQALERHPKVFDHFYTSLIQVSEESGTLDSNLEFLSTQLGKEYGLRKKIQGILLYPAIIVISLGMIGIVLSIFVLPKLSDFFTQLDVKLPLTTQILLFFANLMKDHGILVIGGIVGLVILMRFLLTRAAIRTQWHTFLLSLPLFGTFLQNGLLASLFRSMGIMLKSGLPLSKSLDIQYTSTTNAVFKNYVKRLQKSVDGGRSLEEELNGGRFKFVSPVAVKMIGVGEKTGKLDEMFLYLGDFFEDEVDNTAKNLATVLEPVILLVIGFVVAFVAVAIISPIYELTGNLQGN